VQAGLLLYPFSRAFDLLRCYRDVTVTAPDARKRSRCGWIGRGVAPSAALETFQAAALFDCAGLEGNSAQAEVMAAASANLLWLSEVVGMR